MRIRRIQNNLLAQRIENPIQLILSIILQQFLNQKVPILIYNQGLKTLINQVQELYPLHCIPFIKTTDS